MSYRNVRTWIVSTLAVALGLFCMLADPSLDRSAEITVNSKVGSPSLEGVEPRLASVDRFAEATSDGSVPLNLPERGWVDALRHLTAYEITPPADHPAGGEQYQAQNRAQGLRVGFSPKGIHVVPRGSVEGLRMELSGIGYGDQLERVSDGLLEPSGERINYHRTTAAGAELTEWYVNSPRGVEQGFTLPAPPSANQTGQPLVLELELSGGLEPTLEAGGGAIAFATPDGIAALRYSGLHAYDAGGHELTSWMEVRVRSIALVVDDAKARYPVTVDPLIATETNLTASDAAASDEFGLSVAISGDTAVVGAHWDDDDGPKSGSAYVFIRIGETWTQQAKLTALFADTADEFGRSVAISGDTIVVGAPFDDDFCPPGNSDCNSGSAHVFVRTGEQWSVGAKLRASDAAAGDFFGFSVAISGDTAVVGAHHPNVVGSNPGSAYVFQKPATGWANAFETVILTASDAADGDTFGASVAISGDTAVVGAPFAEPAGVRSGRAYVFVGSGASWSQQRKLTAQDAGATDVFGFSVAISGNTAVVGAFGDDGGGGAGSGSAYVFVRDGTTWSRSIKLTASDAATQDSFGFSVAVSGGGAKVVVGAYLDDDAGPQSGSAYVFLRTATNTWTEEAKLTASDAAAGDHFGRSVAVSGDTAVVGAERDDRAGTNVNTNNGSAYVYDDLIDPVTLIKELIEDVEVLNLKNGIDNSLDAKLNAAIQTLEDANNNNIAAAISALQAFINAVQAQSGKEILEEDADELIASAQVIIDLLKKI